ncbi:hypothetical protein DSCOOX_29830 [Desulfosarcina ovata subsp. ovata]|uniref:Uncharacterized protein n=2 Tax=Desulfosarcina ovata TaxID=83564 RepID=A0A5K8AAQ9_9BACT|nr:hypothetical protein DSCOOX_29830 [Desulfosarcina ovata subsp. ovata]
MDMDTVTQIANAYLSSDFLTGVRVNRDPEILLNNMSKTQQGSHWLILERDIVNAGETIGTTTLLFSKVRIEEHSADNQVGLTNSVKMIS